MWPVKLPDWWIFAPSVWQAGAVNRSCRSPRQHDTNSSTECSNRVIANVLHSIVDGHQVYGACLVSQWMVEFAINDPAFPLATVCYADRGQHPRCPLSVPGSSLDYVGLGGNALASHMAVMSDEVCSLMHKSLATSKTQLGSSRHDVQVQPGNEVLGIQPSHSFHCSLLTAFIAWHAIPDVWIGPLGVLAQSAQGPTRIIFTVPSTWRYFSELNVRCLHRYLCRPPEFCYN